MPKGSMQKRDMRALNEEDTAVYLRHKAFPEELANVA